MQIVMKGYNLDNFKDKDIYSWEEIIGKIEEMESTIHELEEKIEIIEQDKEENFKRIEVSNQVCVRDSDFI